MAGSNWQQLAGGSVNPYDVRRDDGTPTADYGEHIISDGGTVTLPSPKADKAVLVSNISQDTTVTTSTGLVEQQSDVTHLSSVSDPVLFVSDGSDWYVANNLDYVIAIPDSVVLDAGGDPTKTTDTVAGSSGVDVVDYDGSDDYSQTTQISSTNDVIAIVWTGKVKTTNNNDFYVDGGSLLELSMNDDDTADGWRLFRGGSNFAVSNSGSVKTDYVTYSLIGRNGNEVGLKINNNLVAGFATGQSFQQLTGATIGGRADGSVAGSKFIEYSVIDSGTIADVDAEASRQGSKYGTF